MNNKHLYLIRKFKITTLLLHLGHISFSFVAVMVSILLELIFSTLVEVVAALEVVVKLGQCGGGGGGEAPVVWWSFRLRFR